MFLISARLPPHRLPRRRTTAAATTAASASPTAAATVHRQHAANGDQHTRAHLNRHGYRHTDRHATTDRDTDGCSDRYATPDDSSCAEATQTATIAQPTATPTPVISPTPRDYCHPQLIAANLATYPAASRLTPPAPRPRRPNGPLLDFADSPGRNSSPFCIGLQALVLIGRRGGCGPRAAIVRRQG